MRVLHARMPYEAFRNAIASPALLAVADHWHAARGTRLMPSWADLKPSRIASQLPIVWVYKYDRSTREFVGRLAGDRITRYCGKNFRGIRLEDLHPPELLPRAYAHMNRLVEEPALYHCAGRLFRQRERTGVGERIMLPLAADGVHPDGVLGASDYDYAIPNPAYAPIEIMGEDIHWFSLAPEVVAA